MNEAEEGEEEGVKSKVAELDPEPQVSGNGYSNRVLSIAKGVPTISADGELRDISSRFTDFGFISIGSVVVRGRKLDMWSVVLSPVVSIAVAVDVESDSI
jgi:hypothetical protein